MRCYNAKYKYEQNSLNTTQNNTPETHNNKKINVNRRRGRNFLNGWKFMVDIYLMDYL